MVVVRRKLPPGEVPAGEIIARELETCRWTWPRPHPSSRSGPRRSTRGIRETVSPEYQPALPEWEDEEGATRGFDLATRAAPQPEEVVRDELQRALGDRFTMEFAAVKRVGKTTGGMFASAYHIKVAVRDGTAFWLSSGNWQSSNQPDPERLGPDVDPDQSLRAYNREWHVVVDHPGLARVFEQFIEHDLAEAARLQRVVGEAFAELPDVFVPEDDLARTRGIAQLFPPKTFTFTAEHPLRVQPLLTPDNYAGHIAELIRSARESLCFQNQYPRRSSCWTGITVRGIALSPTRRGACPSWHAPRSRHRREWSGSPGPNSWRNPTRPPGWRRWPWFRRREAGACSPTPFPS